MSDCRVPERVVPVRPRVRLFAVVALAACALWIGVQAAMERTASVTVGLAVALPAAYLLARAMVVGWRSRRPAVVTLAHCALAAAVGLGSWRCTELAHVQLEIALLEIDTRSWGSVLSFEARLRRIVEKERGVVEGLLASRQDTVRRVAALVLVQAAATDGIPARSEAFEILEAIAARPADGPFKRHVIRRLGALPPQRDARVLGVLAKGELPYATVEDLDCARDAWRAVRRLAPGRIRELHTLADVVGGAVFGTRNPSSPGYRGYLPENHLSCKPPFGGSITRGDYPLPSLRQAYGDVWTWFDMNGDRIYLGADGRYNLRGQK